MGLQVYAKQPMHGVQCAAGLLGLCFAGTHLNADVMARQTVKPGCARSARKACAAAPPEDLSELEDSLLKSAPDISRQFLSTQLPARQRPCHAAVGVKALQDTDAMLYPMTR